MLFFRLPVSFLLLLLFLALIQSQAELGNRYIKLIEKKCINVENPALTIATYDVCEQAAHSVEALDECVSDGDCSSTATPTNQADCDLQSMGTCSGGGTECSSIADGPESTCIGNDDSAGDACKWTSINFCKYSAPTATNYGSSRTYTELVQDPEFVDASKWNLPVGWQVAEGVATSDGTGTTNIKLNRPILDRAGSGGTSAPASDPTEEGIPFKITFEIKTFMSDTTSTGYTVKMGQGSSVIPELFNTVGIHEAYVVSEGANPRQLYITAKNNAIGSIERISVKELKSYETCEEMEFDVTKDCGGTSTGFGGASNGVTFTYVDLDYSTTHDSRNFFAATIGHMRRPDSTENYNYNRQTVIYEYWNYPKSRFQFHSLYDTPGI